VLDRRPGLDERHRGERRAHLALEARGRRPDHDRLHGRRLRAQARRGRATRGHVIVASIAIEEVLLLLKIGFLLLLYLFIWRIVRTASRDLRTPQESMIIPPQGGGRAPAPRRSQTARLVVVGSPALREGEVRMLDSAPLTVGRGPANDVSLDNDDY